MQDAAAVNSQAAGERPEQIRLVQMMQEAVAHD